MISPMQIFQSMIQNNPNVQNNPMAQNFIEILQSGDSRRGEEMANNILSSYGVTKEQALNQARDFFKF